jgi:hypothetical protein
MTNYYVYYRVDGKWLDEIRLSVEKLFKKIKKQTDVQGRWLRRRDDPSTYMEIYEGVKDEKAFEAALAREAASFGVQRKTETFVDVPDRARMAR